MTTSTPQSSAVRRDGPFSRWRTRDILITASIAVVFGVVFFAWSALWEAAKPLFTVFPPAHAVMYGIWLVPGILAPYLTRKAGSGLLAEVLAALVEMVLFSGLGAMVLLYGVIQGLMAEAGYAIFRYRMWRRINPFIAGATAGIAPAILDNYLYYPTWAFSWQLVYAIAAVISTAVLGGVITLGLHKTLRASGALPARRDG